MADDIKIQSVDMAAYAKKMFNMFDGEEQDVEIVIDAVINRTKFDMQEKIYGLVIWHNRVILSLNYYNGVVI